MAVSLIVAVEHWQTLRNTSWLEFDVTALRHNISVVKQRAPSARILAMLKANGYGHGADWVAANISALADGYGLARLCEAESLRASQPEARLLLLGTLIDQPLLERCSELRLDLVIHRLDDARQLSRTPLPQAINVWLKRNIGMNRLGMNHEAFVEAHRLLADSPQVADIIHMSHFSDADEPSTPVTAEQCQRLCSSSAELGRVPRSMANSAAIIAHPYSHFDWVRPGIMLYGDDPTGYLQGGQQLQAVMQFKSRIIAIKDVETGDGVGYNRRWTAPSPRRIATVGVGYADGYPRHAEDGTPMVIRGQRVPLAGRVSMDLLTVDVSTLPDVEVGDEVLLWGHGLPAAEVASHCQTISYELFTGISDRVERHYPD